jgi:hypothetical protein
MCNSQPRRLGKLPVAGVTKVVTLKIMKAQIHHLLLGLSWCDQNWKGLCGQNWNNALGILSSD